MEVAVSSSRVVSATPSSSGGRPLTLCPCSSMRSLSQETVLHELLQYESFPWAAALHKLPQHGSLPQGAVLQERAAPAWVPHGVISPASKAAPAQAPHGFTAFFRHPPAPAWDPPRAAGRWISAPLWTSMGCRGQPASPRSAPGAARKSLLWRLEHLLPSPSSLTLVPAELFISQLLTRLSYCIFSPLLNIFSQRHYHCH